MKILLTGAGGFLGKRIAASLLAGGAVDLRLHFRQRAPAGLIESLAARSPTASLEEAGANLLAREGLSSLVDGVGCIVHAAAGMRGAPADLFANTVVGSRNLMSAAVATGVRRLVLISSFSVYRTHGLGEGGLLDESVPLEEVGVERGPYAYAKTTQERLVREMAASHGVETVILRPGVIYGPEGGALSPRVGIKAMGVFFSLGGGVTLPLTFVDNCADAIAQATLRAPANSTFNVVDDDLPSCREYLAAYRRKVRPMRSLRVPHWALKAGAQALESYHRRSKGQLPAVLTPYIVASMYRPLTYSNAALRAIGWRQAVPTRDALDRSFAWWRDHPH